LNILTRSSDDIVDGIGPLIHEIGQKIDTKEDSATIPSADGPASLLTQFYLCRQKAMTVTRRLGGEAVAIKGFAKHCNEQDSIAPRSEIALYLCDIQEHVLTMISDLGRSEELFFQSHSTYVTQLSVARINTGIRLSRSSVRSRS
jgi:magnesium transporter